MATKPAKVGQGGGANCTLSYKRTDNGRTTTRAYRLRATMLNHGLLQIAAESHARTTRAYYPHRRSQARFSVTFALLGRRNIHDYSERERFNAWMKDYMSYLLDEEIEQHPPMTVSIPVRGFLRDGIPLGPLSFGEHVGAILWTQTITFETTKEPLDSAFALSDFDANGTDKDKNSRFYYPAGKQLRGNQKPDTYDSVTAVPGGVLDPADVNRTSLGETQDAVNGTSSEPEGDPARVRPGGL